MYSLGKKLNLNDLSPVLNVTKKIREYSVKRIIFDSRLAQNTLNLEPPTIEECLNTILEQQK